MSAAHEVFVGIDVSKEWFDVAVRPGQECWRGSQDEAGVATLTDRLQQLRPRLVIMEASGGYERLIAAALARIHRCGAALGLEQGVRAVGRDGPRSIPINGAGGGLWLSLGAPMAVLGSGAGAGSAGQHAGEDNRGPGRCDSVGRLGSLVDVSGAVGAVRQAMAGLAIEPGRE